MNRIEFTGAAGVGKTTLYNKLQSMRDKNNPQWLHPNEAIVSLVKRNIIKNQISGRRGLINLNLFKNKHLKWSREILSNYKWKMYEKNLNDYNEWFNFYIEAYHKHIGHSASAKLVHAYLYFGQLEDICYMDYFNFQDTVIWEEGLIQHLPAIHELESFQNFYKNHPEKAIKTLPKAVVYCKLDVETNFKRRLKRISENKANPNERILNEEQLYKLCSQKHDELENRIKSLEGNNVKVLTVDMSRDFEFNIPIVDKFLSENSSKTH